MTADSETTYSLPEIGSATFDAAAQVFTAVDGRQRMTAEYLYRQHPGVYASVMEAERWRTNPRAAAFAEEIANTTWRAP